MDREGLVHLSGGQGVSVEGEAVALVAIVDLELKQLGVGGQVDGGHIGILTSAILVVRSLFNVDKVVRLRAGAARASVGCRVIIVVIESMAAVGLGGADVRQPLKPQVADVEVRVVRTRGASADVYLAQGDSQLDGLSLEVAHVGKGDDVTHAQLGLKDVGGVGHDRLAAGRMVHGDLDSSVSICLVDVAVEGAGQGDSYQVGLRGHSQGSLDPGGLCTVTVASHVDLGHLSKDPLGVSRDLGLTIVGPGHTPLPVFGSAQVLGIGVVIEVDR